MTPTDPIQTFTWELPPAAPPNLAELAKGVAFGLPEAPEEQPMPIWRIDLPADEAMAARQIQHALDQVLARQAQLDALPAHFDRLAIQAEAVDVSAKDASTVGASYAVPETADADAELIAALAQISSAPAKGAISFGLAERISSGWEQVNEQFQAFADRLQRTLVHLAWVETRQEGKLIGQTVVGWSGDCDTVWGAAVTPGQMALHHQSLETALQSRVTLLSTFTTAVQGAVKLSVLLTTPGGIILALPTVWRYINQVLSVL
jgi:hypothetical protein